nr:MAG TPA: hypothetical protein [Bacteriophage sp.]
MFNSCVKLAKLITQSFSSFNAFISLILSLFANNFIKIHYCFRIDILL